MVNFDAREAPQFDEAEYRTFLGQLNGILRTRKDILVLWPVTDSNFAQRIVQLLQQVGGRSAFGNQEIFEFSGITQDKYNLVLERILQVANWRLEDAAISQTEVDSIAVESDTLGLFLDKLQGLIAERFEINTMGVTFPTLVIAVSSGEPKIREICRSLRRADSFYLEASRLLMYTRKSNVAEWWSNRATHLRSALPHIIALFNAQLVSISASTIVHAVLQFGSDDLRALVTGVRADRGNAKKVMTSSELYKYIAGEPLDNREYGSNVKDKTFDSYARLQQLSKSRHLELNKVVLDLAGHSGCNFQDLDLETTLAKGLQTDAVYHDASGVIALEFHHKAR